jgi:N,N'-diacetyllegionaminate synthase
MQIKNQKFKTLIIAEVGPNHNGSLKTALKIIKQVASTGADVIKFQLAIPENVYSEDAFMADYQKKNDKSKSIIEMSRKVQLKKEDHIILKKACDKEGIMYACSAFDLNSLKFLDKKIDVPFFKIPSGEILSVDILDYISKKNKPVLLSTGMATVKEISYAFDILRKNKPKRNITLMHCVSSYPANKKDLNLNFIDKLKSTFGVEIGYSDHSLGSEACLAAVAKRATVIEKHVTLSKKSEGPDHKASMEIKIFKKFVQNIRKLVNILGNEKKFFTNNELDVKKVARKSLVTAKNILKGHKLKKKDLVFKRPGYGIMPTDLKKVLGRTVKRNIKKNKLLQIRDLI